MRLGDTLTPASADQRLAAFWAAVLGVEIQSGLGSPPQIVVGDVELATSRNEFCLIYEPPL